MTEKTVFQKIEQPQLASAMGSGSLDVLATPAVVALMEYAASSLADELLGNKELTTVGTRIAIDHTSPTPVGAEVTATARLIAQNGRTFEFEVSAADQKGEIARGTHTRVSVKAKSFQQKADTKFNRYTYVLFDLDGTISRSAEGIRASLERRGKNLNYAYEGIEELLNALKEKGCKLAVCTSKYEPFAREIVEILELSQYFDAVCGSNLDGSRKDKRDLIPYAVTSLGGNFERDRQATVLLGDTYFDTKGAVECGVDFIGVEYGYGTVEEMKREGAKLFAKTPADILTLLNS